jgi:hypothetical protein
LPFDEKTVLRSIYRIRFKPIFLSFMVFALIGVLRMPPVRQFILAENKYPYLPAWWVIRDMESSPLAMTEIMQRVVHHSLSDNDWRRLIERGLRPYEKSSDTKSVELARLMQEGIALGKANADQIQRFVQQCIAVKVTATDVADGSKGVPFWVEIRSNLVPESIGNYFEISPLSESVTVDSDPSQPLKMGNRFTGIGGGGTDAFRIRWPAPGSHRISVTYKFEILQFPGTGFERNMDYPSSIGSGLGEGSAVFHCGPEQSK